jgi:hypothetical protein
VLERGVQVSHRYAAAAYRVVKQELELCDRYAGLERQGRVQVPQGVPDEAAERVDADLGHVAAGHALLLSATLGGATPRAIYEGGGTGSVTHAGGGGAAVRPLSRYLGSRADASCDKLTDSAIIKVALREDLSEVATGTRWLAASPRGR